MVDSRLPAAAASTLRTGAELGPDEQVRMVRALRDALSDQHARGLTLIETHISFVLLCGEFAYKIKKAIKTSFLDNSTQALRQHACEEELRLNRRLAPDLYLSVVPITGVCDAPVLEGTGPMIDCAVKMRAFDQQGLWDALAARGALRLTHIDDLVRLLGPFHAAAAAADPQGRLGSPARVRVPMLENLDELDRLSDAPASRSALQRLRSWEAAAFIRLESAMAERLAQGRVRECHGDLHLGNVTQIGERTTPFDGIEFNDDFRWIDVISELAFMAMDLHAHGLAPHAHRLVNGYLELTGDYGGVQVLNYYLVYRALVRAKVALMRAAQYSGEGDSAAANVAERQRTAAARYLDLALQFSRPACPVLMLTHGFSGSGKSTLTQGLVEAVGAIRIRADVERKRLAGLRPLDRSRSPALGALYTPRMTAATYARLCGLAAPVLAGGYHVILDATFLRRTQRDGATRFALDRQVSVIVLDFEADPVVLRERVRLRAARGDDPSEADEAVLDVQMRTAEPLQPDEAALVFRCHAMPAAGREPQADWAPLLDYLSDGSLARRPPR